jgi:hypothetical protein
MILERVRAFRVDDKGSCGRAHGALARAARQRLGRDRAEETGISLWGFVAGGKAYCSSVGLCKSLEAASWYTHHGRRLRYHTPHSTNAP